MKSLECPKLKAAVFPKLDVTGVFTGLARAFRQDDDSVSSESELPTAEMKIVASPTGTNGHVRDMKDGSHVLRFEEGSEN